MFGASAYNPNVGLFIVGGLFCKGLPTECYDGGSSGNKQASGTWISTDFGETFENRTQVRPGFALEEPCAVFIDDTHVLVAGGHYDGDATYSDATWILDLSDGDDGTWASGGTMTKVRTRHTCKLITDANGDQKVLAIGGDTGAPGVTADLGKDVDIYDVATDTWSAGKHCLLMG